MSDPNLRGLMVDDLTTGRRPLGSRGGVAEYATDANGNTVLLGADGTQYRPHLGSVLLRYINSGFYTSGHGIVAVTGAVNNGAGLIRLTCDASKMVTGQ